jgi:hypothetical protein
MFVGVNEKKKYKTKNEKLQRFEGDLAEKLLFSPSSGHHLL